jgi:hypothetical protein
MKEVSVNTPELEKLSKDELLDKAVLKNISGGNGGTSQCTGGWTETCGSSGGDWCGHPTEHR